MTVDYAPSDDGNYDETLRLEKTTSERKSKLEQSSENEADGDDNEQKPELEQFLTITDVFGASFRNDKISSSSSCSYSSSVADADKDEYSSGADNDDQDDTSNQQNGSIPKTTKVFLTLLWTKAMNIG